jgi:hypothetical protein
LHDPAHGPCTREACVFSALTNELKAGDVAVAGSENHADYREQLLSWDVCEPLLLEYFHALGLPNNAVDFTDTLQKRLSRMAALTDEGYLDNGNIVIDENGIPALKRHKAKDVTASAQALETTVLEHMRERSVIEVLCDVAHWTGWTRHFGPLSGSDTKLDQPTQRYVLTTFTYGCNLGPAQAARHLRGAVSSHMLSFVNRRHKNRLYQAFRALGGAVRTLFLLQDISNRDLREQITAPTNKVEPYNGFAKFLFFGGEGGISNNDPLEQEKTIKYNDLVANAVIFYNVVEQTRIIRSLMRDGWKISRDDLAVLSPLGTSNALATT